MKAKHTDTPWKVRGTERIASVEDLRPIALMTDHRPVDEREANAEFICHAVNLHEELVTAVRDLYAHLPYGDDTDALMKRVHTILDLATSKA